MPVGQSIWKVDKTPERLPFAKLKNENELEDMICQDMGILYENWQCNDCDWEHFLYLG